MEMKKEFKERLVDEVALAVLYVYMSKSEDLITYPYTAWDSQHASECFIEAIEEKNINDEDTCHKAVLTMILLEIEKDEPFENIEKTIRESISIARRFKSFLKKTNGEYQLKEIAEEVAVNGFYDGFLKRNRRRQKETEPSYERITEETQRITKELDDEIKELKEKLCRGGILIK